MADKRRLNLSFSLTSPQQREAWRILSSIPAGQRTDTVCRMVCKAHEQDALLSAIRGLIREELRHLDLTTEKSQQAQAEDMDENVPYALQRINDIMNRNQLCVVPPKSSETEQKSPVSLHIIFGFSQARTATQSTPYPVPNEMPLEDQDELSLSPKQLAWPRYLLWRRPQW